MTETRNRDLPVRLPTWLIKSKTHPTKQRVDLLKRTSIVRFLDENLDKQLSLIHAPAGYGKSTLLENWRTDLIKNDVSVAWLSIDHEDNDPVLLLTYISLALKESGSMNDLFSFDEGHPIEDFSTRHRLSSIVNAIDQHKGKLVLILDDFENLERNCVSEIVLPLLNYAPENLHIAIASREVSHLKISDLEIAGLVNRVEASQLKFTIQELEAFLDQKATKQAIKKIYSLTEGWPVIIQMFGNALKRGVDVKQLLSDFQGNSSTLTSYLSEQIFSSLDESYKNFLMDVSIIDRISNKYVDYLREGRDNLTLQDLSNVLTSLVLPIEALEGTFRFHPLFRSFLNRKLIESDNERASELQLKTADWFAGQGNIVRAVRHSMSAHNPERAVEIIEEAGGIQIWLKEGIARLKAIMQLVKNSEASKRPRAVMINCLIDIKNGKIQQARLNFEDMIYKYNQEKQKYSVYDVKTIDHEAFVLESLMAFYEGKALSEKFCDEFTQQLSSIAPNEHSSLAYHYNLLCAAHVHRGLFEEAKGYAESSISEYKKFGSIYGEAYIHFHLGDIYFAQGASGEAKGHYEQGLKYARQHFSDDQGIQLIATVLLSELRYELDELKSLPSSVDKLPRQLQSHDAWFDIHAAGYITTSNLEYLKHGIDAALRVVDTALQYARSEKLGRLIDLLLFHKIGLLVRASQINAAKHVYKNHHLSLAKYKNPKGSEYAWRERDTAVHSISHMFICEGRYTEALDYLNHFSDHASMFGHIRSSIRYEALLCFAHRGMNDVTASNRHLRRALQLSKSSKFLRCLLDFAKELKPALDEFSAPKDMKEYSLKVLNKLDGTTALDELENVLSKRELEIMKQLEQGFSNKVIARIVGISENTVRFHLKNVFSKLHAKNRLQAVSIAQKRNLI